MIPYSRMLFMLILLWYCPKSYGQTNADLLITADVKTVSINELVIVLEQQTDFHFYYDIAQFDSAKFNLTVNKEPLSKTLEQAFDKTDFAFTIDFEDKQVFLTKGERLNLSFTKDFFVGKQKEDTHPTSILCNCDRRQRRPSNRAKNRFRTQTI